MHRVLPVCSKDIIIRLSKRHRSRVVVMKCRIRELLRDILSHTIKIRLKRLHLIRFQAHTKEGHPNHEPQLVPNYECQ